MRKWVASVARIDKDTTSSAGLSVDGDLLALTGSIGRKLHKNVECISSRLS